MKFNSQKYYSLPAKMVFIIFGVSSFLFIIAYVLLSLHSDSARNSYFRANKLNLLIIDLKNDFLEYNTAERKSAFYLYGHDESSEIVIDKITNLYSFINMDEMSGKEIKLGVNKKNNSNMEAIPFLVKSIDRIFQKLVSLESAIGNQEYGLKEDLIIANSQLVLETQITTDTILRVKLADMYELSEQTLTEPNDLIQANYLKESQEFIDMLKPEKKEKLSDSDKSLLTTVGNHRLKYIQFINAVNTLGFDENSGIRKKMFRLMAELKQLTEEHLIHQTDVYKEIVSVNNKIFRIIILIYIIILGLLIYRIYRVYKRYLERIDRYLIYLQEGELNILQNSEANSEMPVIKILSKIFSNLREKDKHLNEIISGSLAEFDTVYHPYDVLGQSLLKMEKTVISERKARKNEEMQKQRETRRIKGLTKFAAILREIRPSHSASLCQIENCFIAFVKTISSISTIKPVSCATPRNSSGVTTPLCGSIHRTKASKPTTL